MKKLTLTGETLAGIQSQEPVLGLTHEFYRYPARFSPQLARALIESFTEPGEVVLDPFVGGGTTLVEASVTGRWAVGVDISPLAVFVSRIKTGLLSEEDRRIIRNWAESLMGLTLRDSVSPHPRHWRELGYQKHLHGHRTWPIRKSVELLLSRISQLEIPKLQAFARCAVLRSAQWALDGRRNIPSASAFRNRFRQFLDEMLEGIKEYESLVHESEQKGGVTWKRPICLHRSAIGLEHDEHLKQLPRPALILTSPPYPGVHVLYHRWQIGGGRETAAPFWIANVLDGKGESYYTFGSRKWHTQGNYFENLQACFRSIAQLCDYQSLIVQVVGFSNPKLHLSKYLSALKEVGLEETIPVSFTGSSPVRVWRRIPNRRWYVNHGGRLSSGREVVLFHKAKR